MIFVKQVLRNWGQKTLSNTLNEAGRKLLALETVDPSKDTKELDKGTTVETTMDNGDPGSLNLQVRVNRVIWLLPKLAVWTFPYLFIRQVHFNLRHV